MVLITISGQYILISALLLLKRCARDKLALISFGNGGLSTFRNDGYYICRTEGNEVNKKIKDNMFFFILQYNPQQWNIRGISPGMPTRRSLVSLRQPGIERRRTEDQFFNRFAYFIKEGIHKYALSEDDAFNAYSDSILAAMEKIVEGSFEGRSSLKTWLYQIFNNKCVDLIRKKSTNKNSIHRTESISDRLLFISDSARSVVQDMINQADLGLLREKLRQLGETCRQLLWLSADGVSDKRKLQLALDYKNANVVKTSRLRCLEKLRQLYKNQP